MVNFFSWNGLILLVALTLNAFGVFPAFADDSEVLRPPVSTVDLGASRRALRALMNDWEDDERAHAPNRRWLCLNALMEDLGSPLIYPSNDLLWDLPRFFSGPNRTPRGTAPVSLREKLRELAARQELRGEEREALQRLEGRSLDDRLDQIRWVIELQGELMRISERLYAARWKALQKYARENPTFLTGADEPVSLCLAARSGPNAMCSSGARLSASLRSLISWSSNRIASLVAGVRRPGVERVGA